MALFARCFFLLCMFMLQSAHSAFLETTRVRVTNSLEGNSDLTIHIKSKDDDLGKQILHPGAVFEWKFEASLFGRTQFFGTFQWPGISGPKWFDIYIQHRDDARCVHTCNWIIKKEGPCFNETPLLPELICYPWNN